MKNWFSYSEKIIDPSIKHNQANGILYNIPLKFRRLVLLMGVTGFLLLILTTFVFVASGEKPPAAPKLTNNPSLDIIATNVRPLLSIFNASSGIDKKTYIFQIDTVPTFDSASLIEYKNIRETNEYITEKRVEEKHALQDKTTYYWRACAVDEKGNKGPWAKTRFFLDTASDDEFMNLIRIPVKKITVSGGQNPKNIIDLDDPGQDTFWMGPPSGELLQWIVFDLGKAQKVKRVWMLSNISGKNGWLKNFVWQWSNNNSKWTDIPDAAITNNDTFRNIIDIEPFHARYFRLLIKDWYGYAPQINTIIFYAPGTPKAPTPLDGDYVLLIGNQMDGFTFSELAEFIENLNLNLKTLIVPHYEASLNMINKFKNKPVAIICSGNNANYEALPMFEYNGEFEIIRECQIPILGICCGHQLTCMAYGYTFARSMGWSDITSLMLDKNKEITKITIKKDIPIFQGMPNPFTAPEIHSWAVSPVSLPGDYEITSESTYIQSLKSKTRFLYTKQFHAEVKADYNEAVPYLVNFLKIALQEKRNKQEN